MASTKQGPKVPGQFGRKAQPGFPPACVPCRKVKMRCVRDAPDSVSCSRCQRLSLTCETIPLMKVGRKKSNLNDHRSLQRAVEKLRAELQESRTKSNGEPDDAESRAYADLQQMLQEQRQQTLAPMHVTASPGTQEPLDSHNSTLAIHSDASTSRTADIPVADYIDSASLPTSSTSQVRQDSFVQATDPAAMANTLPDLAWLSYTNLEPIVTTPAMSEPILAEPEPFQLGRQQQNFTDAPRHCYPVPWLSATPASSTVTNPENTMGTSPSVQGSTTSTSVEAGEQDLPPKTKSTMNPGAYNPLGVLAYAAENSASKEVPIASWDLAAMMQEPNNAISFAAKLLADPQTVKVGKATEDVQASRGLASLFSATNVTDTKAGLGYYRKQPGLKRDDDPSFDPVRIALVDEEMLGGLFDTFFRKLNPFLGILDPQLHTPRFVARRSYLLLTWVLASAAQFTPGMGTLATRLRLHGEHLSRVIHASGHISVEIIQAYYIAVMWQRPAKSIADELTWLYTHHIFGLVQELGLAQTHLDVTVAKDLSDYTDPRAQVNPSQASETLLSVKGKVFRAPRWFDEVGVEETDIEKETFIQRLLRNGERTYLRVVIWERALAAAFGRASYTSEPKFTDNIESWWSQPTATSTDRETSALIVMRRHFASLPEDVLSHMQMPYFNKHPHRILEHVDDVLSPWVSKWLGKNERVPDETLPRIYMRTCFNHGRLWVLSFTLNSKLSTRESARFFEQQCLDLAVEVSEILLKDYAQTGDDLFGMMTPTWAMAAYACHLAVRLFPIVHGAPGATARLLGICAEVATLLEKAGTTPSHRVSSAAIFGRHLRLILRSNARALLEDHKAKSLENSTAADPASVHSRTTSDLLSQGASPTSVLSSSLLDGMGALGSSPNDIQWLWNDAAWSNILAACLGGNSHGSTHV